MAARAVLGRRAGQRVESVLDPPPPGVSREQITHDQGRSSRRPAGTLFEATREARAQESETFSKECKMSSCRQTRAQAARRDADAARLSLRWRGTSASPAVVPGECRRLLCRADAAADVSASQRSRFIQTLAAVADRHANDARTLIEGH